MDLQFPGRPRRWLPSLAPLEASEHRCWFSSRMLTGALIRVYCETWTGALTPQLSRHELRSDLKGRLTLGLPSPCAAASRCRPSPASSFTSIGYRSTSTGKVTNKSHSQD